MVTEATLVAAMPMASAFLAVVLFLLIWPDRKRPSGMPVLALMAAVSIWSFFYGLEILLPTLGEKLLMAKFQYLGIAFVAPAWCLSAARLTGYEHLFSRRGMAFLMVIPVMTVAAAFTNDFHHLLWREITVGDEPAPVLHFKYGPIFWVNNQYAWLLLMAGTVLIIRGAWAQYRLLTLRNTFMILTVLAPWAGNFIYVFRLGPIPYLDLTPCAFVLSGVVFVYGITRMNLTRIVPIAREHVLENFHEGLFVMSMEGQILDVNRTGLALLGCSNRDILGQPAEQALSRFPDLLAVALAHDGAPLRIQVPAFPESHFEASASTLSDRSGIPFGRIVVCRDITQQVEAEARLRQSEAIYRGYFEMSLVGMASTTPEKGVITVNDYLCTMLGYSAEELSRMTWADLTHPDDLEENLLQFNRILRGEIDALAMEKRYLRKDGGVVVAEISVRCVRRADGAVDHLLVMLHDVTQRKAAEEALRQSESKARYILNASRASIALFDLDLQVQDCNQVFARSFGMTVPEMINRSVHEIMSPEAMGRRLDVAAAALATGETQRGLDERDGIWYEYTLVPAKSAAGEITGLVLYADDVTEHQLLQQEKDALTVQYQQAQRMEAIGQLAGGVAHDFNNLLQVIQGYTQLAQQRHEIEPQTGMMLEQIANASEHAATLVGQLLAFSRRQVLQRRSIDLNKVAQDTVKMVERLIGADIRLDFTPSIEPVTVLADPALVGQVLMNLCVNARDAMPDGGSLHIETCLVTPDVSVVRAEGAAHSGGKFVRLDVTDTGTGMDVEVRQHIFEPFFTTKDVGHGTGLGLATVYGIVRQHDGFIQVDSTLGTGTTFHVYLPATEASVDAVSSPRAALAGGTETVLVVEDNDMVRTLAKVFLTEAGYKVIEAANGELALDLFDQKRDSIALVLLDVIMPGLSGRQVYEEIQRRRPGTPVLFVSGYHAEGTHTNFILDEGLTLLPKPYTMGDLLQNVRAMLQQTNT
ncbi:MAG: PAS domain S-box protein [Candidatus Hydrogenedens sp.]|nr:PAS domain S-box protein [Candidatus Hydrogenedens sp.]